jgi:hypothetical protein
MNLYLHYGVSHKQSVLKSNDKAKTNPEHTVKYNLSNTRKTPKTEAVGRRKHHRRQRVCHRPIPYSNLTQETPGHHQTRQKNRTWLSRAAQSVKNTLARDDHAPFTDEFSGRSGQRLRQRTATIKARGRVSTRGQPNSADLASKIDTN